MSLIYTPLPLEEVLGEKSDKERDFQEVQMYGKKFIVENLDKNRVKITKLISSNPNDYLDSRFQPGNIVEYFPGMEE